MNKIPKIVHFVFGLRPQLQPFHLLHYLAIESCRKVLHPDTVYLHYHHLPYGVYWDAIRPHLTLARVDLAHEVLSADYDDRLVPEQYRYAHHADFVRLDALIEHGGIYADIDTLFLRPLPETLYHEPFVIGREQDVADEKTGEIRPSLCNALLMSRPGSLYAKTWRQRMGAAINGSWSNHSGFLAQALSEELPDHVHVEPIASFFPVPCSPQGLHALFENGPIDISRSYSVHLWAHVWWSFDRIDFSRRHAGELSLAYLRQATTPLGDMVRPFLPDIDVDDLNA
ncbi:MAG: glycosyl transferase [Gammaproteobacteria bacterium]|nr:glycosyl transferase [Gammaproteobacteria bacterium]